VQNKIKNGQSNESAKNVFTDGLLENIWSLDYMNKYEDLEEFLVLLKDRYQDLAEFHSTMH